MYYPNEINRDGETRPTNRRNRGQAEKQRRGEKSENNELTRVIIRILDEYRWEGGWCVCVRASARMSLSLCLYAYLSICTLRKYLFVF